MLESIKRWFSGASAQSGAAAMVEWAQATGHPFKRTREGHGFVVEGGTPAQGWRLEWGEPQRSYIKGQELRVRADLGGGADLQMLLLSRSLMETLEKQVFEQFTEGLQTRIDTDTPEEMRWLVLFPKPPAFEARELREDFGAVASMPQALSQWLGGPLSAQLIEARKTWLQADDALALVVQRGRLTLRFALPQPSAERVTAAMQLYEVALQSARRVAEQWGNGSGGPSTHPSLWSGALADSQNPPPTRS
jgi:hypothetical protein